MHFLFEEGRDSKEQKCVLFFCVFRPLSGRLQALGKQQRLRATKIPGGK